MAAATVVCLFGIGSYSTSFVFTRSAGFGFLGWVGSKPHEVLSAFLTLLWLLVMSSVLEKYNGPRPGQSSALWVIASVLGGLGILLYYPFWALATMAFALLLGKEIYRGKLPPNFIAKYLNMTLLSIFLSSPYWLPYVRTMMQNGAGPNYALKWFDLSQIDPSHFTFGMGYVGILFGLGLYGLVRNSHSSFTIQSLRLLVLVIYCWIGASFLSFSLLKISLLPQHAPILLFPLWSFFAGMAIVDLLSKSRPFSPKWSIRDGHIPMCALCIALLTVPSAVSWNSSTDQALAAAKRPIPPAVEAIADLLEDNDGMTLLGGLDKQDPGVIYFLPTIAAVNLFIPPVPYYANPLQNYHKRVALAEAVFEDADPALVAVELRKLGVEGLILTKVSADAWGICVAEPHGYGYEWRWLTLSPTIVRSSVFNILYEDSEVCFAIVRETP